MMEGRVGISVMPTSRVVSVAKDVIGLAACALTALSYAMAFMYSSLVPAALAISFILLTAPIWLNWLGRPMRLWPVWYLFVFAVLFLGILARFVIEALMHVA
jgi:hypothetical protein